MGKYLHFIILNVVLILLRYLLFCQEERESLLHLPLSEQSKELSNRWKTIGPEEKDEWKKKAAVVKEQMASGDFVEKPKPKKTKVVETEEAPSPSKSKPKSKSTPAPPTNESQGRKKRDTPTDEVTLPSVKSKQRTKSNSSTNEGKKKKGRGD